ncbi:MAG: chromosomal replication initiator protein DnaA, partial [Phycisphaerae bacterium]
LGPRRFKVWFKNATQFHVAEGFLRIGVPNHFIGGWIERHFADSLHKAARDVLNQDVQLSFMLDPELVRRLRKTQLNSQAADVARSGNPTARSRPPAPSPSQQRLRGRLDEFVVGSCNRIAYSAAQDVAEHRPTAASPLFLHGGCGLGKTHLLHGIGNTLEDRNGDGKPIRWLYVTGEEFTNRFLYALRARELEQFRRRYRNLDVLLVDDLHFLANKKATQDEFLHTFNAIDMVGKRIVLASDAHPRLIGQMSEALISRFVAGMVVRLESPGFETRCDILRRRFLAIHARRNGSTMPTDVIEYIADRVRANVRELEGSLLRVMAHASMSNSTVTLALARQALEDHATRTAPLLTVEHIQNAVATFFGLTTADLHTSRKTRTIALARSITMFLARRNTKLSFPELGRLMGNKNHSTVLLACRRIQNTLSADGEVTWQTAAGPKHGKLADLLATLEQQCLR